MPKHLLKTSSSVFDQVVNVHTGARTTSESPDDCHDRHCASPACFTGDLTRFLDSDLKSSDISTDSDLDILTNHLQLGHAAKVTQMGMQPEVSQLSPELEICELLASDSG